MRNILKSYSSSQAVIYIMGMKYKDLNNLVSFMYQGEVSIDQDDLQSFIHAAEQLQLEGLFGKQKESANVESYKNSIGKTFKISQEISLDSNNANDKSEFIPELNFEKEEGTVFKNTTEEVKHSTFNETKAMIQENMPGVISVSQGIHNIENLGSISKNNLENKVSASHDNKQDILKYISSEGQENIPKETYARQDIILNTQAVPEVLEVNKSKVFSCTKCEKLFNRKTNLHDHQLSAHEGVRYQCDLCKHGYRRIDILRAHVAQVHENSVRYPCDLCDYVAPRSENLSKHAARIHNKGFSHPCDKCDKKSTSLKELDRHKATHVKPDKLPCGYCDRKFEGKALLNNHIARLHKRVTYACDNCDRTFNNKGSLTYHINAIHSNNL